MSLRQAGGNRIRGGYCQGLPDGKGCAGRAFGQTFQGVGSLYAQPEPKTLTQSTFSNSLGDLKKNIEYIIGMERQSGNMDTPTPQDIAPILNVSVEEFRQCMKEMGI